MKICYRVFSLIISIIIVLTVFSNTYAQNSDDFSILEKELGIISNGQYTNTIIDDIEIGTVIEAVVIDPSKLGGCKKGDKVQLIKLDYERWSVKHYLSNNIIFVVIKYEDDTVITKRDNSQYNNNAPKKSPQLKSGLQGRSALGGRISYVDYYDDYYYLYGIAFVVEPDDAIMFGLNFTGYLTDFFSIELSVDYANPDVNLSALGLTEKAGELNQIPILLSGRLNPPIKSPFIPFIGGGFGYFINDFVQEDELIEFIYGQGAKVSIENSIGYFISGGFDIFTSKNLALNIDFKYIWNKLDTSVNLLGYDEEISSEMSVIGGGIKYFF